MAVKNGGIIGPANTHTGGRFGVAKGVWRLADALNFTKEGTWPTAAINGTNTVRFNDGSSDFLSRTAPTPIGSRRVFTVSCWVKRTDLGSTDQDFYSNYYSTDNMIEIRFTSVDSLRVHNRGGASTTIDLRTTRKFRDVSAWYHVVVAFDTTQSTASDRVKIYINGVQETAFSTETYPSLNQDLMNEVDGTYTNFIGKRGDSAAFFDGYLAESVYVNNSALDPTSFREFNSTTGIWTPIPIGNQITSFGNTGYFLDYSDSSNLGKDLSPNGNNFTVNNLTSVDQSTDLPTNTFNTLSPLLKGSKITLSQGNLVSTGNTGADAGNVCACYPIAFSGKWYFEVKITGTSSSGYPKLGVLFDFASLNPGNMDGGSGGSNLAPGSSDVYVQFTSSVIYSPDGNVSITSPSNGDIFMFALDMENGAIYVGENGTWLNSGDPTSGASKTGKIADLTTTQQFMPVASDYNSGSTSWNFGGAESFTISSGNSDANGYGNFEYAVPSGYYSLCTANLNTYG